MSEIPTPATPVSTDSNKRELTSPFDPNEPKKPRSDSVTSESSVLSETSEASQMETSSTRVRLCDEELERIVARITDGVVKELRGEIKELQAENADLKEKLQALEDRLERTEDSIDQANQYSRRNCLRISGIKEDSDEDTDQLVLQVSNAIDANITLDDIDRSHRLGRPRTSDDSATNTISRKPKPRDIIVKFTSYRTRSKLFKKKSKLRDSSYKGSFINEDLTRPRSELFYQCRLLARKKNIDSTWTSDGVILVKDNRLKVHRIQSKSQLADLKVKLGIRV